MNFWYKVKEINFHSRHINVRHFGTAAIFDFVSPRIQSKENNIWKMTFWQRQWFSPRGRSTVIGFLEGRGSKSSYHDNFFHVGNNNHGLVLTVLGDSIPFPWRFFRLSITIAIRMINRRSDVNRQSHHGWQQQFFPLCNNSSRIFRSSAFRGVDHSYCNRNTEA